MNEPVMPTGPVFRLRVIQWWLALCVPAALIGASCPYVLLSLTPDQWRLFLELSAVSAAVVIPAMIVTLGHLVAPVLTFLPDGVEAGVSGTDDPRVVRRAFAAVMDIPRRAAVFGGAGWLLPAVLVGLGMSLSFDSWGVFESAVVLLAGTVAGFGSGAILHFGVKRVAEPVRDALAAEITDPEERRALIRPISVKRKLLVSALGLTVAPAVFALLLAHAQAVRSLESLAVRWQEDVLARVLEERADDAGLPSGARSTSSEIRGPVTVWQFNLAEPDSVPFGPNVVARLREEIARGESGGSATTLDPNHVLAWRRLEGDRVVIATTPSNMLSPAAWRSGTGIVLLLGLFMAMAVTLAVLLASDLGRMARALRAEVDRLASGDLRRGRIHESEDELGDLMRSFQAMAASLRSTVGRVAEAADRVEATAGEMTSVSESLGAVTAAQVEGLERASTSVASISGQVQGIAESSHELNRAMEESRSSILELGAAGDELNETATVLTGQVEEVSSSIEEMVRSVRQVSGSVDALAEAAAATSTSMDEMATSMSEVDDSADETGRLFEQVVDRAESGREKVRQTIAGMEEIREATETAERVIRNLGNRTDEIGAIVDVIDDVADETNLLALNAAIIAAQAGEHGRAFSVVADQIKDLADRVLASTKEIGGLIRAVQAEGSNAIGAIERGTRSVASGVDLSAQAGVSLDEITRASRESGARIEAIVTAVREQSKAAAHVVSLMERVRGGVEEIRGAASEQDRGNEVVYRGSVAMQQVAERVRATTDEQARGSGIIRERSEEARDAVERIHRVLQEQARASAAAVTVLKSVVARTRANEESAQRLDGATKGLLKQSAALRQDVQRFKI